MSQWVNQSVGQLMIWDSQSTSQPAHQTVTQSVGQLQQYSSKVSYQLRQSVSKKFSQTVNQLVSWSIDQPVKSIDHSGNYQSVNKSVHSQSRRLQNYT